MARVLNITRAVRRDMPTITVIYGMSGSGKTYSSLMLARGLAGDRWDALGMIDTETGRGSLYANGDEYPEIGGYLYGELTPPFTPERYCDAIDDMADAGVEVCVLDSSSHLWEGLGGILEMAEETGQQGLLKWQQPKARYKKFVRKILLSRMHMVLCVRAKNLLVQKGKQIENKGYVPIQEKGFIFEATIQLFMPHFPIVTRDLIGIPVPEKVPAPLVHLFPPGRRIARQTGELLRQWSAGGAKVDMDLEVLRRDGEAEAGQGKIAFTRWWNLPETKKQWEALRPFVANFASIAKAADLQVEENDRLQKILDQEERQRRADEGGEDEEKAVDSPAVAAEGGHWDAFVGMLVDRLERAATTDAVNTIISDNVQFFPDLREAEPDQFARLDATMTAARKRVAPPPPPAPPAPAQQETISNGEVDKGREDVSGGGREDRPALPL